MLSDPIRAEPRQDHLPQHFPPVREVRFSSKRITPSPAVPANSLAPPSVPIQVCRHRPSTTSKKFRLFPDYGPAV